MNVYDKLDLVLLIDGVTVDVSDAIGHCLEAAKDRVTHVLEFFYTIDAEKPALIDTLKPGTVYDIDYSYFSTQHRQRVVHRQRMRCEGINCQVSTWGGSIVVVLVGVEHGKLSLARSVGG